MHAVHHYEWWIFVIMILTDELTVYTDFFPVGGRKLRFQYRKNYERKKWSSTERPALPSALTELMVQLPIASYTATVLPDNSQSLHQRISKSGKIPFDWVLLTQQLHFIWSSGRQWYYTLQGLLHQPNQSSVNIILTINSRHFWKLILDKTELSTTHCSSVLNTVGAKLDSVDAVIRLISLISNEARFCIGNSDTKFLTLCNHRKGTFKDRSGICNQYSSSHYYN